MMETGKAGIIEPRLIGGIQELNPEDQFIMDSMIDTIKGIYKSYGYNGIDTSILNLKDILLAKSGGETSKQIYRVKASEGRADGLDKVESNKQDKQDVALRFDLTVPLSRYVAMNKNHLVFPFRCYQIGKSFRGEKPQRGRFREFYQSDVDIISRGNTQLSNNAEVIAMIFEILGELGLSGFTVRISNRKLLTGICKGIGIQDKYLQEQVMQIIDKLAKIGKASVLELLLKLDGIDKSNDKSNIEGLLDLISNEYSINNINQMALDIKNKFGISNSDILDGLDELSEVVEALRSLADIDKYQNQGIGKITIDMSIVRGLDYYTGLVLETTLDSYPDVGSICSGGQYDSLVSCYSDEKMSGIGASIGISRLFYILKEQNLLSGIQNYSSCDIAVMPMLSTGENQAVAEESGQFNLSELLKSLRNSGLRVQALIGKEKFKKKLDYANKSKIPFVLIIGEDEIKGGYFTLKNMLESKQIRLNRLQEVIEEVRNKKEVTPVIRLLT